jgi:D-alanyl-D-alanine dipeptidase
MIQWAKAHWGEGGGRELLILLHMRRFTALISTLLYITTVNAQLPDGFVYLSDIAPSIRQEVRYAGTDNFIGKPIDGYESETIILTKEAGAALVKVQAELRKANLSLKVYDAYRPQRAVDHFVRWAQVESDTTMKTQYYPAVPKNQLFKLGFIASKSGHTRGSTVDLTMIDLKTGEECDMGGPYDFFGSLSHHDYDDLSTEQRSNRVFLKSIMSQHGFKAYAKEWWHYTLRGEPYPDTYFDFLVR